MGLKDVEKLFSAMENISLAYSHEKTKGLPKPVQRYFRYSLKEKQRYITSARLMHGGKFKDKPNQPWLPIKGQEYFTIEPPGFVWLGKIPLVSARDMYHDGKGYMRIRLLSLVNLIDAQGIKLDQSSLTRWLSETPWFPTALLPSKRLAWKPVDNDSAKVIMSDKNLTIDALFNFNEKGQIIRFKAKRYGVDLDNWTCHYRDYRQVAGMHIPFYAEAAWNLESGDFTYAKFNLDRIEYNNPSKF